MILEQLNQLSGCGIVSMFGGDMARRRGKQKGTLKVKGPSWIGYWWEEVRSATGERVWHKFNRAICPSKLTKKQAQREFEDQVLNKLETASLNPQSLATVEEYWRRCFDPTLVLRKKTVRNHYRYIMAHFVIPAIGSKRMRDVRLDDVQDIIVRAQAKYSPQTLTHIRNVVSAVFKAAKRGGYFQGIIPVEGVVLPELVHKEPRALTADQARTVMAALSERERRMVLLMAATSLRIGEASGLRWKRVNLTEHDAVVDGEIIPAFSMAVREAYVRNQWTTPKKYSSRRNVPLESPIVKALKEWRDKSKFTGPDDPVFASRNGTPVDGHNIARRKLKPIGEAAGCPWISWQCLRHTAATLAEIFGITPTQRKKVLGHATDRMALHYTHADLDQIRPGMALVAEALTKPTIQ
jgi:integrase